MKSRHFLRNVANVLLLVLGIVYGMLAYKFELPPYGLLNNVDTPASNAAEIAVAPLTETPDPSSEFTDTPSEYYDVDVDALISIEEFDDIETTRSTITEYLWGSQKIPMALPAFVTLGFSDERYDDVSSLRRIDKLLVEMEFGLESHIYHFHPKSPNDEVILFHQGHRGDFIISKEQISFFLDHGYSVIALSMPLLGLNNQPTIQMPTLGDLHLTQHDHMKFLSPENGHSLKFFFEPVFAAINYVDDNYSYSTISMVGISGGGWTTTVVAALDARIRKSFPVAGSYPVYLRSNSPRDWGDYEQTVPEFYKSTNYLSLYVLGAVGEGRKQLQIINQYDTCCFAGTKWDTYLDSVQNRVESLGYGEFDLYLDSSHNSHGISPVAMERILLELGEKN